MRGLSIWKVVFVFKLDFVEAEGNYFMLFLSEMLGGTFSQSNILNKSDLRVQ
jgi:hypothetical protein